MADYKREIINSLEWYNKNKANDLLINGKGYGLINAQDKIRPSIIGTLASIVSKSNGIKEKFVMSMAQIADGTTKVSLRMSGNDESIDLKQIIASITEDMPNC